ncbi:MAG: argininosuccinate lyase [Gammaproteobacteria bacterium]|nr:MAG: argininosuccinate lyase [Gammaproteobacteria bacterium]
MKSSILRGNSPDTYHLHKLMTDQDTGKKLWGGRFTETTDAMMEQFNASVAFDQRLFQYDIAGSIAHASMLSHVGILTEAESRSIIDGLEDIRGDIEQGQFAWSVSLEDVHMNIESRLIDRIGDVGKKLHTGRSRNDQVATDVRLYLRDQIDKIATLLAETCITLATLAEQQAETIMPGLTHLQPAQPISFGHHLLAWAQMLRRDGARLVDCRSRVNIMPLGSAALAGTSYPIDRTYTAKLLGFDGVTENSLDAVSDRDFVIEFLSCSATLMMHMSRFSEELILWSTAQFDFIELSDKFCTGSSIMPQKKNPDIPELIRGKSARVFGNLMALLTLMKGQPLAYNKDNQEDKEPLFDTVDTVIAVLTIFIAMMKEITIKSDNMERAAGAGYTTATDLADYLVRKNIPFRDAHEIVGKAVRFGIDSNRDLAELGLEELKQFSAEIADDVFQVLTLKGSIASRDHIGGTAPDQVRDAAARMLKQFKQP